MYKTIQNFRGLLNIRSCNRIIASKYCVTRKDGTPSETWQKSTDEKNEISESEISVKNLKREEGINLSSKNEVNTCDESVESTNFKSVEKVEPVKNDPKSDISVAKDSTGANKELKESKLKQLIHSSEMDTDSKSQRSLKHDLQPYIKRFETEKPIHEDNETFAALLRKSAFIDLGDPVNKLVIGKIYLVVDDELYIDFGWKFPAICPRPKVNPGIYNIGAKVLLRIKDLELTAKFLGDKEYTSLLEADCDIIHRINEDGSKYVDPQSEKKSLGPTQID